MRKSKYVPIILETLEGGPASLGTLKNKCGQGDKITNIRKPLHQLLKDGIIEVNGYDNKCKMFISNCVMFKKAEVSFRNPIYIKGLLDNPIKTGNYDKLQQIFKHRIYLVNQIYHDEIKKLNEIQGEMPLKEAIELGYIQSDEVYKKIRIYSRDEESKLVDLTFSQILEEDPQATVWYWKKNFISSLMLTNIPTTSKYPKIGIVSYTGDNRAISMLECYKRLLDHLPIKEVHERDLFKYFVIGALREEEEKREDALWELALLLTDDILYFVEKLRVVEVLGGYNEKLKVLRGT